MRSGLKWAALVLAGVFVAIQLVPVERSNPPVDHAFDAPAEVEEILRRACYDCHSNETRWPWYSRVAPVSWLVAWDVGEAREELNFSEWSQLPAEKQRKMMKEAWEEVDEGEMPLWYYLPAHPDANLTDREREILRAWARGDESAAGG